MRGYAMRRTHSLIHRGYLFAQKRVTPKDMFDAESRSTARIRMAEAWKQGYLQARRDAKKA